MPLKVFPSEEQLAQFERSYAGEHTELLERLYSSHSSRYQGNQHCLVCLEEIGCNLTPGPDSSVIDCETCPRKMHNKCLNIENEKLSDPLHCPLCCKRGWNIISSSKPCYVTREDRLMARTVKKAKWEEKYSEDKQMQQWLLLKEDGSLESDRRLLVELEVVNVENLRAAVEVSDEIIIIKDE